MKTLFILFLFCSLAGFSQRQFVGSVFCKSTGRTIPYVTIGLIKENKGTTSDDRGNFTLASHYFKDSIIVSSVGYKTIIIPLAMVDEKLKIELEENSVLLDQVVISNKASKKVASILNEFGNCGINYYSVGLGTFSQIAQHYCAPATNMQLIKLHICKEGVNSIFRIRIYDMDSISGKPLHDLVMKNIEVSSSKRNIDVNLEDYNIYLQKRDFYVAIEWLFIPSNEFRAKSKINGQKISYSNYYPGLTYKDKKNNSQDSPKHFWMLNFNGKWQPPMDFQSNFSFLISAELNPL